MAETGAITRAMTNIVAGIPSHSPTTAIAVMSGNVLAARRGLHLQFQ